MKNSPTALRILLVEDDLDIAASLGDFLEAARVQVDFAYNAAQALARVDAAPFDVLVLDVNLPGEDGFTLSQRIRDQHGIQTPVLFLTARAGLADKLRGFEVGAIDYMVKPFAPQELLARLHAVHRHLAQANTDTRSVITIADYVLDLAGRTLRCGDQLLPLSATGFALLKTLMRAHPGTVSAEELSRGVWGDALPDSDPLRAHIHQLRRHLEQRFSTSLISTVRGVGYRFGND